MTSAQEQGGHQSRKAGPLRLFRLPHVQHHDDEEEQDHDGAGVDDNLENRNEGRRQQIKDPRQGEEGGGQIDDGMNRMALGYGKKRRNHHNGRKNVEDDLFHK